MATFSSFNENQVLLDLKKYLPNQAPLKDFISQNSLAAFQNFDFEDGVRSASKIFGYKHSLTLKDFRNKYRLNKIFDASLEKVIISRKGQNSLAEWKNKLLNQHYDESIDSRIGVLRNLWKQYYRIELDFEIQPLLFRVLCSYLDQGISIWNFSDPKVGFLNSLREMEKNSMVSFFKTPRAKKLFLRESLTITDLLDILVGDETFYHHYLFDQQFAHPGWSGMVAFIENNPNSLLDSKKISLRELIFFELLLEIDALDQKHGETWAPLKSRINRQIEPLFDNVAKTELSEVLIMWQEAFEWSYYDQVLLGIKNSLEIPINDNSETSFQAMFCIDDRECSIRRHIELIDKNAVTYGTAGFFNVEFYFQPATSKFYTKVAPAPMQPKYLIKEISTSKIRQKDAHFTKKSHSLILGWLISQTLGFWSALKLAINIFRPSLSPATSHSFDHMDEVADLSIEYNPNVPDVDGLRVGFTFEEMAIRVEGLLKSIGLVDSFATLIYVIGHGSTSVNNTHYAAYDCGACSGRPGSVNARVVSYMANHPKVRQLLSEKGIQIPEETQFLGALHDTTRDEIMFYDEQILSEENKIKHIQNKKTFLSALDNNAKERSVKFELVDTCCDSKVVHEKVKKRSVSLFEPRPEITHTNNALCVVGGRYLTDKLFLDRRSFLNSYDYRIDLKGDFLVGIMNAVAPVCGGINLQYFFSRVDNQRLGSGSKLSHNVMGLFGVANGIDGDLRPGLASQMVDLHTPMRLIAIVEHYPNVIVDVISKNPNTYEWFHNNWIHLVAIHPDTNQFYIFKKGFFEPYEPSNLKLDSVLDINSMFDFNEEPYPVYIIEK